MSEKPTRRGFLGALASVPFVGAALYRATAADAEPAKPEVVTVIDRTGNVLEGVFMALQSLMSAKDLHGEPLHGPGTHVVARFNPRGVDTERLWLGTMNGYFTVSLEPDATMEPDRVVVYRHAGPPGFTVRRIEDRPTR